MTRPGRWTLLGVLVALGCVSMVVARRIPLVDEEAQMVLGMAVFIRASGLADTAQCLQRVVQRRGRPNPDHYTAMFYQGPSSPYRTGRRKGKLATAGVDVPDSGTAAATLMFPATNQKSTFAASARII